MRQKMERLEAEYERVKEEIKDIEEEEEEFID